MITPADLKPIAGRVHCKSTAWPDEIFIAVECIRGIHGWAIARTLECDATAVRSGVSASAAEAVASAVSAAIAEVVQMASPTALVVTASPAVEDLVKHAEVAARGLSVNRIGFPGLHVLGEATSRRARAEADVTPAPPVPRTVVAAVDGSFGRKMRRGGWAFVTESGKHAAGSGDAQSSDESELRAIDLLLTRTRESDRLVVLTDSQTAIAFLEGRRVPPPRLASLVDRIAAMVRDREVTFTWVKGHAGHALNEAADRLAIAERRHLEWANSRQVHRAIQRAILAEELGLAA